MRIAVIQASSQRNKNPVLEQCVKESVDLSQNEVVNFGIFQEETLEFSYVQTAFCVSMLLESKTVDFVITGCSSGQGMMLACNSLPGVLCGYVSTPADAFLFGRINHGNAISYPLGLYWGWAGEISLKTTLAALFAAPFGCGYPPDEAGRKRRDTEIWKELNGTTKRSLVDVLPSVDREFLRSVFQRKRVLEAISEYGREESVKRAIARWNPL